MQNTAKHLCALACIQATTCHITPPEHKVGRFCYRHPSSAKSLQQSLCSQSHQREMKSKHVVRGEMCQVCDKAAVSDPALGLSSSHTSLNCVSPSVKNTHRAIQQGLMDQCTSSSSVNTLSNISDSHLTNFTDWQVALCN